MQRTPFPDGFPHAGKIRMLEIPEPAMNRLEVVEGRTSAEVSLFLPKRQRAPEGWRPRQWPRRRYRLRR